MRHGISLAAIDAAAHGNLENFIAASTPGGIEAQEAAGQARFVGDTTLPRQMLYGCTRETLEQMGITFGGDVDDLFVSAQLPPGWKKQATGHSMWSDLLDEQGRKRAAIFYKAAFYDRGAHIILCQRYTIDGSEPCDSEGNRTEFRQRTHLKTVVKDGDAIIHVVAIRADDDYQADDVHREAACAWLDENYPDWNNPLAYWA